MRYRMQIVCPDKVAPHHRALAKRTTLMAELQMSEKQPSATTTSSGNFLPFLAFPVRAHPNHAARERAFAQNFRSSSDNVDAGGSLGVRAEVLHKAAM